MMYVSSHPRSPVSARVGRNDGCCWIEIKTRDAEFTIFARNEPHGVSDDADRPTLSDIAEALAQPMIELDCDKQAADHDREEAARLAAGGSPIECDLSDVFGLDTPAQDVSNGLPIKNDATPA